jgi:hypothetical protein
VSPASKTGRRHLTFSVDKGDTRSVKSGRQIRQRCYLLPISFNQYNEDLTKESFEGVETSKYEDQ